MASKTSFHIWKKPFKQLRCRGEHVGGEEYSSGTNLCAIEHINYNKKSPQKYLRIYKCWVLETDNEVEGKGEKMPIKADILELCYGKKKKMILNFSCCGTKDLLSI